MPGIRPYSLSGTLPALGRQPLSRVLRQRHERGCSAARVPAGIETSREPPTSLVSTARPAAVASSKRARGVSAGRKRDRVMVGSEVTRLVVVRGNSASGKSCVAARIRERFGRGLALVGQDNLRRTVLREHDVPGGASIGLIDTVARYALDAGYHVVVEGILYAADRYGDMLSAGPGRRPRRVSPPEAAAAPPWPPGEPPERPGPFRRYRTGLPP